MVEIDGQTIYFKRLVMKTTFTYDSWLWRVIRWFSKDLLRSSKDHTIISVDALGFGRSSKPMDFYYSFPTHANLYYKLMKN